jgi:hypothetical protein
MGWPSRRQHLLAHSRAVVAQAKPESFTPCVLVVGNLEGHGMNAHYQALHALQRGVMDFVRDALAFDMLDLQALSQSALHMVQTHAIGHQQQHRDDGKTHQLEPPCLVESRGDCNGQRRADVIPDTVIIGGDTIEWIISRAEIGMVHRSPGTNFAPIAVYTAQVKGEAPGTSRAFP